MADESDAMQWAILAIFLGLLTLRLKNVPYTYWIMCLLGTGNFCDLLSPRLGFKLIRNSTLKIERNVGSVFAGRRHRTMG